MTASASRVFEDKPATRERTPLLIGLIGASSSGKTFSALRLASGIQRVAGGDIYVVDTEARRALHYADKFKFRHLPFGAPFGSLDYLAAIEHCAAKGAKTIVIDSASHEHEGPGGVLEVHESETQRLAALWKTSTDKANMAGWQKPKSERRRLLNTLLQMPINFVFCFRAKEKMDLNGAKPRSMGWMPIAGEEFIYEMTLNCLLYPGSDGVPTWKTNETGEKTIIKLPGQFRSMFSDATALSEDTGEKMARWAAGDGAPLPVQAPSASGPPWARQDQIDELGREIERLAWPPAQAKEWLQTSYGVGSRAALSEEKAGHAITDLMERA